MDFALAMSLFLAGIVVSMVVQVNLTWPLFFGFCVFFALGIHRGYAPKILAQFAIQGTKSVLVVVRILLIMGLLTATWRASGTIAFFVYWGIEHTTPSTFLLAAFLLPALLCLAFGSSMGVAGTAGIILMTIARSGGADLALVGGAILSGSFFGERLSPASSAAALNATINQADLSAQQRELWKDTWIPLAITLVLYTYWSFSNPIAEIDQQISQSLATAFDLSLPMVIPGIVLLVLPWFHVKSVTSIAISTALAGLLALVSQDISLLELLTLCLLGYQKILPGLDDIMVGGGLRSMISVILIVSLSTGYCGILSGIHALDGLKRTLSHLADRIGLFPVQFLLGLLSPALFCNQAVSIVIIGETTQELYKNRGYTPLQQAVHGGNGVINLAGLVPWAVSCSVPLTSMGATPAALPYAVYLYLVPLYFLFVWKKRTPPHKNEEA